MPQWRAVIPFFVVLALVAWLQSRSCVQAEEPRAAGRIHVSRDLISSDDGDSFSIRWPAGTETVRILGIDAPEVLHLDHNLPYAQPFGEEAAGFLRGCLAVADRVEVHRSGEIDPFGRTLGYLYLNGKNYSVLALQARLAVENVGYFGDNGLPEQAKEVLEAAKAAGPVAFEPPHQYRARMRKLSEWMKAQGTYPSGPAPSAPPPGR